MRKISKKKLENLSQVREQNCVSVFMPTHRVGQKVYGNEDKIMLKNLIREVSKQLSENGLNDQKIKAYLQPIEDLINDSNFWRHQLEGLALFLSEDIFEYFILPANFDQFHFVSDHFYLKPLMPLFNGDGEFFILSLSLSQAKLFKGNRYEITEVDTKEHFPDDLLDAVGSDFKQRPQQFRAGQNAGRGGVSYQSYGAGKDEKREETLKYLRTIDKGLTTILNNERSPLVIASVDYLFHMYKEISDYQYIFDKNISGNPENDDPATLHAKAWDLVSEVFDQDRYEKVKVYNNLISTGKTSNELREIVKAAVFGKIDTLFVQNDTTVWGEYLPEEQKVIMGNEPNGLNTDLLNMAAIQTFLQGGKTYLMDSEKMPDKKSEANAIFRY